MSTLKDYAKRAKQRLKSGFWEQARQNIKTEQQVAATLGLNARKVGEEGKRMLERKIYDYNGFCEEQEFYNKVVEIIESDELISNPIMRLADPDYLSQLDPSERQSYLARLAAKYRAAVEKYRSLHK